MEMAAAQVAPSPPPPPPSAPPPPPPQVIGNGEHAIAWGAEAQIQAANDIAEDARALAREGEARIKVVLLSMSIMILISCMLSGIACFFF